MQVHTRPIKHLTYCMNIHAGTSWADQFAALHTHTLEIKQAVCPQSPFGLGLRISAQAAQTWTAETSQQLNRFCSDHDCYPFTVNGFPYAAFHGTPVKERVYAPDWRTDERRRYTEQLAQILSTLSLPDQTGSISTVPGSYRPWIASQEDVDRMVQQLSRCACALHHLEEQTGTYIHVGLEPEPDCFLETTVETVQFFTDTLWPAGSRVIQQELGASAAAAEEILRRHLGVCLDTCHAALQFEDPAEAIAAYERAGILISKVQLSAALETGGGPDVLEALIDFVEPVYLHQVKIRRRTDKSIEAFPDLGPALPALEHMNEEDRARIHFHVPLFRELDAGLHSTAHTLTPAFFRQLHHSGCRHIETETYTYDVLPDAIKPKTLTSCIQEELRWAQAKLQP